MNSKRITVLDFFEETVKTHPNKCVIKDVSKELTYEQIYKDAKHVAYNLSQTLKKLTKKPIVVFIDKGCECLTAMLGVLYSGNSYVPMDIKTPIERLDCILSSLESDIVIATTETNDRLKMYGFNGKVLLFEELIKLKDDSVTVDRELSDIRSKIIDTDLMYILFTSGSTGNPKGVAIMHRSVIDYVEAFIDSVPITYDDVIGNQVPFYVDMSLKDIYMSIAVGATICVIPQKYFMTPKKVMQYILDNEVTMLMWVPTAYSIIKKFECLDLIRPATLKKMLFSGERMPISVFRYWKEKYPDAIWIQQYGPTEITGACTMFTVERMYDEDEMIPIGKPFTNTGLVLLDENDNEISSDNCNEIGEICVFGSCLAAGYYNNPQKTAEVFVQNPLIKAYPAKMYRTGDLAKWDENENLVFISRKDYQIKHGGRRIELGEIENAVDSISQVKSCCCVYDSMQDVIILFYTGEISEKDIRECVKNKIPQYMVPGKYIKMEELPRLGSGKLDRKGMLVLASCGEVER